VAPTPGTAQPTQTTNIVDELATLYGRGASHGLRSGIDTRSPYSEACDSEWLPPRRADWRDAPRRLLIGAFIVCAVSVIASLLPFTGWWVDAKIIIAVGLWAGWLASSVMSLRRGFLPARFDVREGRSFTPPVSRRRGRQIASNMFGGRSFRQ
jgi:hypothetical protein